MSHEYNQSSDFYSLVLDTIEGKSGNYAGKFQYVNASGNSVYEKELSGNLTGETLKFSCKGNGKAVVFVVLTSKSGEVYKILLNPAADGWNNYSYELSALQNDNHTSEVLVAENIAKFSVYIQDWSGTPSYSSDYIYMDDIIIQ